jgi:hypothetical protein
LIGSSPAQTALGTTQSLSAVDGLREFTIQTSGYTAENGRNPGGQIQFTTRSGTNGLHGTLSEYFRNEDLDANSYEANYYGDPKTAERQNDFGATIGGQSESRGRMTAKTRVSSSFPIKGYVSSFQILRARMYPRRLFAPGPHRPFSHSLTPSRCETMGRRYLHDSNPVTQLPTACDGTWASATTASWSSTTPWAPLFMRVYALGSHGSSDASPRFVQSSRKRFRCLDGRANQRKFNFGPCSQG